MNPAEFSQFHDDLQAAIIANAPVEIDGKSGVSGKGLTLTQLDRLKDLSRPGILSELESELESGGESKQETHDWANQTELELPLRYRAAMQVFDQTRTMLPVLTGLSTRRFACQQVARVMRSAFIYLGILLVIAFWGLLFFESSVIPQVDDMRAEIWQAAGRIAPARFEQMLVFPVILALIGIGFVLLVIWMFLGGVSQIAMWMGGRHYVRCRISNSVIRTMRSLLEAGTSLDRAVSLSCDLNGANTQIRRSIQALVQGSPNDRQLKTIAEYFKLAANQRLASMRDTAPIALICSVGGVVVLSYCLVLFWPVVTLLHDLAMVGG